MKKLITLITITLLLILTSCSNDETLQNTSLQNQIDVYVAGQKDDNACYWLNGQLVLLDNVGLNSTTAKKIIVQNNNIYVLGRDNSQYNSNNTYLFWENGVVTNLDNVYQETNYELNFIADMTVSGSDLYLLGYLKHISAPSAYDLVYWKNGVKTVVLQNCVYTDMNSSIKVVNNDVYILSKNETNQSGIFVNNTFNLINTDYLTFDMTVSSNEVYGFGVSSEANGFYKNINTGTETITPYRINKLVFDSGDKYTVVDYNNQSFRRMIQKNDNPYYISPEGFETHIVDLQVLNGNVYTIVRELTASDFGDNKVLINNNTEFVLDYIEGQNSYLNSLYVVQN